MGWQHVRAVCEGSKSKPADRPVLVVIASRINHQTHIAWPSVATIARETGYSKRHVKYAIPRLEAIEELIVHRGASEKSTHVYALGPSLQALAVQLAAGTRGVNVVHHPSADACTFSGAPRSPQTVNMVHPNKNSSLKEISEAQESANTAAEEIVNILRSAGIWNATPTEQLIEVARLGARAEDLLTAIQQAKGKAGDPFAYGLKVVLNRLQASSYVQPLEIVWEDAPRSIVEARGEEVGIGKWDDRREQWPQYKARVTHLLRNRNPA